MVNVQNNRKRNRSEPNKASQQDTNHLRQKITFTSGNETEGYSSVLDYSYISIVASQLTIFITTNSVSVNWIH